MATALITMGVALVVSPVGQIWLNGLQRRLERLHLLAGRTLLVIDFRYHLVSIVAIFLALAVGIVLGTTLLQEPAIESAETLDRPAAPGTTPSSATEIDRRCRGARRPTTRSSPPAPRSSSQGELTGQRVVIVEAPGATPTMREAVQQVLTAGRGDRSPAGSR